MTTDIIRRRSARRSRRCASNISPTRLICVFQPHQHSRTRFLLDDFAASFAAADETIVPDIYFVRDSEPNGRRQRDDLVRADQPNGPTVRASAEFAEIVEHLRNQLRRRRLVVTMGAGNVWEIGTRSGRIVVNASDMSRMKT